MSKVVKAINVMISNTERITDVKQGTDPNEIFFVYDKKHKWSILRDDNEGEYALFYYPGDKSIDYLADLPQEAWREFTDMVSYRSSELGTKEALDSMKELYTILSEKVYGMDEVLEDIISTDLDLPF
jgi:hypothetical protein